MAGHPSEALFCAPNPRDDLAFTMYATEREEINDAKDQIIAGIVNGRYAFQSTFSDFVKEMEDIYSMAKYFDNSDWNDIISAIRMTPA